MRCASRECSGSQPRRNTEALLHLRNNTQVAKKHTNTPSKNYDSSQRKEQQTQCYIFIVVMVFLWLVPGMCKPRVRQSSMIRQHKNLHVCGRHHSCLWKATSVEKTGQRDEKDWCAKFQSFKFCYLSNILESCSCQFSWDLLAAGMPGFNAFLLQSLAKGMQHTLQYMMYGI